MFSVYSQALSQDVFLGQGDLDMICGKEMLYCHYEPWSADSPSAGAHLS